MGRSGHNKHGGLGGATCALMRRGRGESSQRLALRAENIPATPTTAQSFMRSSLHVVQERAKEKVEIWEDDKTVKLN